MPPRSKAAAAVRAAKAKWIASPSRSLFTTGRTGLDGSGAVPAGAPALVATSGTAAGGSGPVGSGWERIVSRASGAERLVSTTAAGASEEGTFTTSST
jgi:hypothetical protein